MGYVPHLGWLVARPGFSPNERWRVLECPSRARIPRGDYHHLHPTIDHLGTVERVTRLLPHSITLVPVIAYLTERTRENPGILSSQRGGWHYWQIPSGENAAGAKRGRPAPRA
uniref:Uncharacterized protein n=1 Tax=Picea glauca TaxID=3330 RepID=A0A101LZA1_PICGL|nr:hypothetical protein ABT39_MTgene5120 [Picea glauca]